MARNVLDNIEVEETTEYGGEVTSIKQIALQHIKAIGSMICQELTPGHWEKKPVKTATGMMVLEKYHPDLKIGYCNAVDFLADLVTPWGDTDFKTFMKKNFYDKEDDIKTNDVKIRKKIFREMNVMFEREGFFDENMARSE